MKVLRIAVSVLLLLFFISCGPSARHSKHLIILADTSASIVPDARAQMFAAIRQLLAQLSRGDAATIMPVANDASGNLQGHILRFESPATREPYDEDLKRFRKAAESALSSLETESMHLPASRTDILGTLSVAQEEFKRERQREVTFIIFSDFLEDDRVFKFRSDKAFRGPHGARSLAEGLASGKPMLPGTPIFCGELRSKEWLMLDEPRREAVREFWTVYINAIGGKVSFAADGPAMAVTLVQDM